MTEEDVSLLGEYTRQQTARAAALLPAAGAFDAAPIAMLCPYMVYVSLFPTYTRGGAGGSFAFKLEASPDSTGTKWYQLCLYAVGVITAGLDVQGSMQRESYLYKAVGAAAESFVFGPILLAGTIQRLRLFAQEVGNVGARGTLEVRAFYS